MGNTLLLITSLHCCEKRSLKYLQFRINKLCTRRGGILGALRLFVTLLIIFQNDFWVVLGSGGFRGGDRAMAQGPAQSTPPRDPAQSTPQIFFYTSLPTAVSKRSGKPPKSGPVFKNI